jgi:hypothetical protein
MKRSAKTVSIGVDVEKMMSGKDLSNTKKTKLKKSGEFCQIVLMHRREGGSWCGRQRG